MRGESFERHNSLISPSVDETTGLEMMNTCEEIRYNNPLYDVAKGYRTFQAGEFSIALFMESTPQRSSDISEFAL